MDNPEPSNLQNTLDELQAENRLLKETIDQMKVDMSDQLSQLKERSDKLGDQIKTYTPVVEDVLGLRVFEKAKAYLISWITLGGVTALVAGIALFAGAWKFAVEAIDAKLKTLSEEQFNAMVQKEAEAQVAKYFKEHTKEYESHLEEVTLQIVQQTNTYVQSKLGYSGSLITEKNDLSSVSSVYMVDYTQKMGNVRNQGQEGSVIGFAISYAIEYQIFKTTGQRIRLSPREIYNLSRKLTNTLGSDSGAQIRDGVTVVQTEGAIQEEVWPYKAGDISAQPPVGFISATRYKVKQAQKIAANLDKIKSALSNVGPLVAGITVYESFESDLVKKSGLVPVPKQKETVLGGHAVCIVGYDDTKRLFKFINSWGDDWGDHGYGYLPYDYIKDNAADIWSISL